MRQFTLKSLFLTIFFVSVPLAYWTSLDNDQRSTLFVILAGLSIVWTIIGLAVFGYVKTVNLVVGIAEWLHRPRG